VEEEEEEEEVTGIVWYSYTLREVEVEVEVGKCNWEYYRLGLGCLQSIQMEQMGKTCKFLEQVHIVGLQVVEQAGTVLLKVCMVQVDTGDFVQLEGNHETNRNPVCLVVLWYVDFQVDLVLVEYFEQVVVGYFELVV
jgi:hypothetical protein